MGCWSRICIAGSLGRINKLMEKRFLVLLLFLSLLGCSPSFVIPSETPATSPVKTQTVTALPSKTKAPSTFTPTVFPLLQTSGPYFSFFRQVGEEYQFVMMDANGQGRKTIAIPRNVTDSLLNIPVDLDIIRVSPDGEWLAYYTGSAGFPELIQPEKDFDLTLNLYNFITGEFRIVTQLLSEDYPDNFSEAANRLNDPFITGVMLYGAFINGITRSLAWSPDGRFISFAGQMDGLSSDLYVYEIETESIRRLSSENQQIQSLEWSPDGKWILYSSAYEVGMGMKFDIFVASIDDDFKYLSTSSSIFWMWLDKNSFILHDTENVVGDYGFRLVNIATGKTSEIWGGPVIKYGLNTETRKFLFATHLFSHSPSLTLDPDPDFVPGLYLMDLDTFSIENIKYPTETGLHPSSFIDEFNPNGNLFVVTSNDGRINPYLISDTGELTVLSLNGVQRIVSSPDSNLWIAISDSALDIYSTNNTLINTVHLPFQDAPTAFFVWRPDSAGIFIVNEFTLYYLDIFSGEIILIEPEFVRSLFSAGVRWFSEE